MISHISCYIFSFNAYTAFLLNIHIDKLFLFYLAAMAWFKRKLQVQSFVFNTAVLQNWAIMIAYTKKYKILIDISDLNKSVSFNKSITNIALMKDRSVIHLFLIHRILVKKRYDFLEDASRSRSGLSTFFLTSSVSCKITEKETQLLRSGILTRVCMFAQQAVSCEWHVSLLSRICILLWSIEGCATMAHECWSLSNANRFLDYFYHDNAVWMSENFLKMLGEKLRAWKRLWLC